MDNLNFFENETSDGNSKEMMVCNRFVGETISRLQSSSDDVPASISTRKSGGNLEVLYKKQASKKQSNDNQSTKNQSKEMQSSKKQPVFRVRSSKESNISIHIQDRYADFFTDAKASNRTDLQNGWKSLSFDGNIDDNVYFGLFCILIEVLKSDIKSPTGCCSLYRQCSDRKMCIIDDSHELLAEIKSNCYYRMNLLQGKIFYGVNSLPDLSYDERALLIAYRYSDNKQKASMQNYIYSACSNKIEEQIQEISSNGINKYSTDDATNLT